MSELVRVCAADDAALVSEIRRIVGFIDRVPEASLMDIAYTCSRLSGESVLAIITDSTADLRARLSSAADRIASPATRRIRDKGGTYFFRDHLLGFGKGRLAFVYPGVMSFYPDMMRDLVLDHPVCRAAFDELEEALAGDREFTPSSFVFPPAPYYRHDADIFKSGAYAQALVATYSGCEALSRLLGECGVVPDGVVGFAGGDLAAMMRSGAAGTTPSRPDRVRIIRDIYRIVHKAVNHGGLPEVVMMTVLMHHPGEADAIVQLFPKSQFRLAVDFSPRQKTYAVSKDFADEAQACFARCGVRTLRLALDRPFNTPLCESLVPEIRKFVAGWMRSNPCYDIYSCATGCRVPTGLKPAREDMAARWAKPVLFAETVQQMYADGYRVFLEVGPRGLMTTAVSDTLRGEPHAALALNSIHRRGELQLQHAVGQFVALGAKMDVSRVFVRRNARLLDFDSTLLPGGGRYAQMRLSRSLPRLTLFSNESILQPAMASSEPKGRGVRAATRAAAVAQQARRQRQFDFGAISPLVSDADTLALTPGVSVEISKVFRISDAPFFGDSALGTSQISYADPNLKGLEPLTLAAGAEIMAETAARVVPNHVTMRIEALVCRRMVRFRRGELKLFVLAERVASGSATEAAVKVQLRDDSPNSAYTWPVMEATVVLGDALPPAEPVSVDALSKPRSVHWSARDIYPSRLCCGSRLRGIKFVETWSEAGLDYEAEVPPLAGNVAFTRFPIWAINPLLLEIVAGGFALWRSHERFAGAFSFPFRLRRLALAGLVPNEGARLKCYMRLTGVTPHSHICDITATDGNGKRLMAISGWEEMTERVPTCYRDLILQPAISFISEPLDDALLAPPRSSLGDFPSFQTASAFISEVPYAIFERNEELWLKALSHIILDADERREFAGMTGSTSRRTEWLFGRVAAKEAVRRFLKTFYQARWSDADIRIWADDSGKPHALGAWNDVLPVKLDIGIAHTAQFVVAVAAANARVGVDVEQVSRDLSEEFTAGVFSPEELELSTRAANCSQQVVKFWCAKEAVSKALGTGIRYSPKEMRVSDFSADTGLVALRLEGAWLENFKNFKGRDILVRAKVVRDHALATCFIPQALFA